MIHPHPILAVLACYLAPAMWAVRRLLLALLSDGNPPEV